MSHFLSQETQSFRGGCVRIHRVVSQNPSSHGDIQRSIDEDRQIDNIVKLRVVSTERIIQDNVTDLFVTQGKLNSVSHARAIEFQQVRATFRPFVEVGGMNIRFVEVIKAKHRSGQ
jgi:hypothetical protein